MGFTPAEVGDMSLWQFGAVSDGWRLANGAEEKIQPPTDEEHDEMVAKYG